MHTNDIKMKEEPTIQTHLSVTQVVKDTNWSHASTPLNTALTCTEPTVVRASKWYLTSVATINHRLFICKEPQELVGSGRIPQKNARAQLLPVVHLDFLMHLGVEALRI